MSPDLKPLDEQVVVITGATSGIGLTTARMAADRGARLVLAARSEDALQELTDEINRDDGDAVYVVADVPDRDAALQVASVAEETYGGFDTWINNAGAFLYGRLDEVAVEDMRALFETNVWGTLYGSLVAADHLRDRGGAIINLGSVVSDRAMILQGAYSASKMAVKGFTDALRMELEAESAPVSVTLIKPAAIDTPYPEHAKNEMWESAQVPPPVYAPETVARAILHSAENPERDLYVGGGARGMGMLEQYAPGFLDTLMEGVFTRLQQRPPDFRESDENTIDEPVSDLEERGDYDGHVSERSLYTEAAMRGAVPKVAAVGLGALAATVYALYRANRDREEAEERSRVADIVEQAETAVEERRSREEEPRFALQ